VAQEVHKIGMDLAKRHRARSITLSTAMQQLVDVNPAPALEPEVVLERECMMCLSAPRHVRLAWVVRLFALFVCPHLFFYS
jgi:ABC-type taurine transport system ATPase subunit